jgi:hypothetical protein
MSPCEACKEQMKKGRDDEPHNKLFRVWSNSFRGSGHEEYVYRCMTCGTLIRHMHDNAPFWTQVDKIPEG